ncbi:MAG: diacylglycerol kinase family protein [Gemmatimonadota bacterium]|nr:MAG: diacylglycerol kinase family protein [Gemmatimonadota bacterium]
MPNPKAPTRTDGHRIAVLCNPRGGRIRRELDAVRELGRDLGGELYREADDRRGIAEALSDLTAMGAGTLCIVGGDGTVHGALTALHAARPEEPWPIIAPVPGGSTNMTTQDLGAGGSLMDRLLAIRTWRDGRDERGPGADGALVTRPILCVEHPKSEALCGMFFGAGAVADGVRFFDQRLRGLQLGDRNTSGLSIARVLFSLAVRGTRGESVGCSVRSAVDGRAPTDYLCIFCLASTLHRLILGTRPHWGEEDGPVHFTLVEKGARAFWRSLPRIARGRPGAKLTPERGYLSHNANAVELTFDGPFVVDGEVYHARAADGPFRITAPRTVTWLVP